MLLLARNDAAAGVLGAFHGEMGRVVRVLRRTPGV